MSRTTILTKDIARRRAVVVRGGPSQPGAHDRYRRSKHLTVERIAFDEIHSCNLRRTALASKRSYSSLGTAEIEQHIHHVASGATETQVTPLACHKERTPTTRKTSSPPNSAATAWIQSVQKNAVKSCGASAEKTRGPR